MPPGFQRACTRLSISLFALLAGCAQTPPARNTDDALLQAAVASKLRSGSNRARDAARHPYDTLRAFGVRADQTIVEIAPGGGWYTEILAPYLRERGHYVAALYVDGGRTPAETEAKYAQARERFDTRFVLQADHYGRITVGTLRSDGLSDVGPPGSADRVLTFRNIHNWIANGSFDAALRSFHSVLKPGGVLGVEEHRAAPGTSLEKIIESGYVPEDYVIEHAKAAGFELATRSEVNANPRDTRDHPNGVWSLPPTLRGGAFDRERFVAIGESDRMTLTFVKPRR
jgi:predicted methyltransferase